ncbi:hypothetical protein [Chryseolinea lacunae]|uniref:Lipoprotein n=1 Tax=Chryseolinea lacunae TaxID=2801331 RepID=A0ABS1KTD0_9BACT|nr:hypothetical protein [Chryseolinea lacunae]MBL0742728.1 hypothetical protein [Chryseolinea lacunae]
MKRRMNVLPGAGLFRTFLVLVFALALAACGRKKKTDLCESFRLYEARHVPCHIFEVSDLNEFDVLSQKATEVDSGLNYPKTFAVGIFSVPRVKFTRTHIIDGFAPADHYEFIKALSDHYASDTTFLNNVQLVDVINVKNKNAVFLKDTLQRVSDNGRNSTFKMKAPTYVALVYRQTNPAKRSKWVGEYMTWKREIVSFANNQLHTETIELLNEKAFK